ncbi:hypothetical protein HGRIS_003080 [Hohenbuehelia grisea]|uniref:Adenylate cyclase n=1 Tax=Hohenbuehelia grisea TaxID=104357 RepID=A0ABR3JNV1_9AGAR
MQPTPPPKTPRSTGFAPKSSFGSLGSLRQPSVTSLLPRSARPSTAQSTTESYSIAESSSHSSDSHSPQNFSSFLGPPPGTSPYSGPENLRKSKSSVFSRVLKKTRSKTRLRSGSDDLASVPPPMPEPYYAQIVKTPDSPTNSYHSPPATPKREKTDKKKAKRKGGKDGKDRGPTPPPLPPKDDEFHLDTNLDEMDGILNPEVIPVINGSINGNVSSINTSIANSSMISTDTSSPSSGFESVPTGYATSTSSHAYTDNTSIFGAAYPDDPKVLPTFSNPFNQANQRAVPFVDNRKVSPTSIPPRILVAHPPGAVPALGMGELESLRASASVASASGSASVDQSGTVISGSQSWTAPESWAVEQEGSDNGEAEGGYSTEEDPTGIAISAANERKVSIAPSISFSHELDRSMLPLELPGGRPARSLGSDAPLRTKRKSRRSVVSTRTRIGSVDGSGEAAGYKIRVYRASGEFHVVSISRWATVNALKPALNSKLLFSGDRELHRLYLKERGRERILGVKERPGDIFHRRLEQAGYDAKDKIELLGAEDMGFLLKFVYKSQLLGPAEEELSFDNFELVDLTGRSLRTVPVVLHRHADEIVSLKLSRNPMLEIPLDFIQSCTSLRELRLSNMSMKKVPQSVRHSITLRRLDLSCNRIVDLDDAGLDRIPELMTIFAQNNRMEKLPWYFPRLRRLTTLNISNNKFQYLPAVVSEMTSLTDLDISFNMISELPDEIGQLTQLVRLIIVGNRVSRLPERFSRLESLCLLDCRRNHIADLSVALMLPKLEKLSADHNAVHALELSFGPCMTTLDASYNEITQLSLPVLRGPDVRHFPLTNLDLSHMKLSILPDNVFAQLGALQILKLDYNSFHSLPASLGNLNRLETFSCCDNSLISLPASIGNLQRLETLDAHNNNLKELPETLWNCASLTKINVTSNLIENWHLPLSPPAILITASASGGSFSADSASISGRSEPPERKPSTAGSITSGRWRPPLAYSLEKLYLGENHLTDEVFAPLSILKELRVLNLSFNELQEMPPTFFTGMTKLEELYLSGNRLTSIPSEDLPKLTHLAVLFLNGNRLQNLPQELGKVQSLYVLDVASNMLKYNINNWEFDWNWNFNKNLRYLSLSGNKKLQIKSDIVQGLAGKERPSLERHNVSRQQLAGFSELKELRVLGLMDVTVTTTGTNGTTDIPDETDTRRVRTSSSTVNGMSYGIADTIGRYENLNMLDLVQEFGARHLGQAIFAMFGHAQPPKQLPTGTTSNGLARFLRDSFLEVFDSQISGLDMSKGETYSDALRRTFLKLNKDMHDRMFMVNDRKMSNASTTQSSRILLDPSCMRSGASGIIVYFIGRTMYVANVGNALAVISKQGTAELVSRKHDPYDREETSRIRNAEGWVSPPGLVNDEVDVSRSFGFYHLLPVVNARPDIVVRDLTELDEFVIIGNRQLWDYVSYQTAVDIARQEKGDPMIAAQKLRDFAISYGAEGSMMIMVIGVSDMFSLSRARQGTVESLADALVYTAPPKRRRKDEIMDRFISRLDDEVPAPTGHVTLVFTDIRNSTHLWEVNPGMPAAMRLHNHLLRRQLRFCGGFEVKTEGDAFMCSFPTALAAVWWCLSVQAQLLLEPWPLEILECEDGKEILDDKNLVIARGLSVRMGIHSGNPLCEPDPVIKRMDYFGPMVNRSARINAQANGGQIMISDDILQEINAKIFENGLETEYSDSQPPQAIEAIRSIGVVVKPVGSVKMKGLESPEFLSAIYPRDLEARHELEESGAASNTASASRVQFSAAQTRELGMLCLRLEALATSRIYKVPEARKNSIAPPPEDGPSEAENAMYVRGDPALLLPTISDKATDHELMLVLDSLSCRIQNALAAICERLSPKVDVSALRNALKLSGLDERTLGMISSVIKGL